MFLKVRSLVNKSYPSLSPHDLVTKARAIMRDYGVRILPVIKDFKLIGLVTRVGVLATTSTKSNIIVTDIIEDPKIVLSEDDDVIYSVKKMIKVDEWYVPTLRNNKYIGMFGLEDFMRYLLTVKDERHDRKVEEVMTKDVETVLPETPISKLWFKMLKHKFAGFPVVNKWKKVIGFVSQHDLIRVGFTRIELESESRPRKGPKVRDIMVTPPITLSPKSTIFEALRLMTKKNIGRIPIVNAKGVIIGIVDREDICKVFIT